MGEDAKLNMVLTELNDTSNLMTLPDVLAHASHLLGERFGRAAQSRSGLLNASTALTEAPELVRSKSSIVLNFDNLRKRQDELVDKVSAATGYQKDAVYLLLLHAKWDDDLLLQQLASDADSAWTAAGLVVAPCPQDAAQRRSAEVSLKPQLCAVCFAEEAVACLPCGHGLCTDDWPSFLKCNLESGTVSGANCLQLRCPGERCTLLVPPCIFKQFLVLDDFERYMRLWLLSFVNDNKKIVWCPAPGCELCIGYSERKSTVRCSCGHSFCFSCKNDAHAPAKCSDAKTWIDKNEKMKGARPCSIEGAKPCPNPDCKVLTHKESGCNYLHCTQCHVAWCWQCGDWGGGPSADQSHTTSTTATTP